MYVLRLGGVRIKCSLFFLLLTVSLSLAGYFKEVVVLFGVILAHELGHAYMARRLQLAVTEVELTPVGGIAKLEDSLGADPMVELKVAMAGPAVNLMLILIILGYNSVHPIETGLLRLLLQSNLFLGAFNLLPALPLDGGRIFRALLSQSVGYRQATLQASRGSIVLGVLLLVVTFAGLTQGLLNVNLLVLAVFLFVVVGQERRRATYTFMQYLTLKKWELQKERVLVVRLVAISDSTKVKDLFPYFIPKHYHMFTIINQEGSPGPILTENQVLQAMIQHGIDAKVGDVIG